VGNQVALVPFGWSGRNEAAARERAAGALRTHLAKLLTEHPHASHFLVAHSHGGSIAMYALQDVSLQQRLSGIVCLSTPFLHARRRQLGPIPRSTIVAGLIVGPWLLAGTTLPRLGLDENTAIASSLLVVCTAAWAVVRWSRNAADRLLRSLSLPERPPAPTLLVRAAGDEAGAALAAMQFLGWLVSVCWIRPAMLAAETVAVVRTWGSVARRHASIAIVVAATSLAIAGIEYTWGPFLFANEPAARDALRSVLLMASGAATVTLLIWWFATGAGLYGYLVGLIVGGLVLSPFVILVTVLVAPFGRDIAIAAVHLEISAEPTPPGDWQVHQLPSVAEAEESTRQSSTTTGLMHSTYLHPEAIRIVEDWVQGRARSASSN
jgi:hypothetical protein